MTGNSVIGALRVDLSLDTAAFETGMKSAKDKMPAFAATLKNVGGLAMAGLAAGAALAGAALVGIGTGAAKAAAEFEGLKAQLITATGSLGAANTAFSTLQKFAATTPYQLADVVESFTKLKMLGLDPSERALQSFGNTASALGKPLNQMIEAVADAATGEFERLKEFGIKAKKQGDQVAFTFQGVTTTVKNNSNEIQDYLLKIGETNFAGSMALQSNTLNGAMSNLQDATTGVLATLGEGLSPALQTIIKDMAGATASSTDLARSFGQELGNGLAATWQGMKNLQTELTPIFNSISKYLGPAFKDLAQAFIEFGQGPSGKFLIETFKILAAVVGGTVLFAIRTLVSTVANMLRGFDQAGKNISGFIEGVKKGFVDLTKVLVAVLNPIQTVQKAFFMLYDKVVGHSYVPDMVDGIRDEFARLPKVMTNVALGEVAKVNDAFAGIGLKTLYKTPEQIKRGDLPDEELTTMGNGMTEAIMKSRDDLKRNFAETFSDGLRAALNGDFGGWFEDWWKNKLNRAMTDAFDKLGGIIFDKLGGGSSGGFGGILGSIFGDSPAFAKGGTVGFKGGGGNDSRLFSAWVSPNELVSIGHPSDMGASSIITLPIYVGGEKIDERIIEISGNVARDITGKAIGAATKLNSRSQSYGLR